MSISNPNGIKVPLTGYGAGGASGASHAPVHSLQYVTPGSPTTCYMVQGGTASAAQNEFNDPTKLPRVSVHTGKTATLTALREAMKRTPIQVVNVYGLPSGNGKISAQVAGRIYVAGNGGKNADITTTPADITVIPQWHADENHGGGATGGVAQVWVNKVAKLRAAGNNTAADTLESALSRYAQVRDSNVDKAAQPGSYVRAETGISDPSVAPAYLVNVASVPGNNYRLVSGTASQYDRMSYVEFILKETLKGVKVTVEKNGLKPDVDKPIRVSIPALGTGPDGAVTHEESAVITLRVLGRFMQENPGYEFIIPLHNGSYENAAHGKKVDNFVKILGGDADAMESVKDIRYDAPRDIFNSIIGTFKVPATAGQGESFDEDYFAEKFTQWSERVSDVIGELPAGSIEGARTVAEKFSTSSDAALATFLYKYAAISKSQIRDGQFQEVLPNPRALKQILQDEEIRGEVFALIRAKLSDFGDEVLDSFAGNAKMGEIISSAAATVFQNRVLQKVSEFHEQFKTLIRTLQDALEAEQAEASQLQAALTQKEAELRAKERLAGEQGALQMAKEQAIAEATLLRREVAALTEDLRRKSEAIISLSGHVQTATTSSSKASSSWGRSG